MDFLKKMIRIVLCYALVILSFIFHQMVMKFPSGIEEVLADAFVTISLAASSCRWNLDKSPHHLLIVTNSRLPPSSFPALPTMSDFHDFGLTWKCQKIFPCGCTITSKTKINIVWNFFYTLGTLRAPSVQKNFKQRWF